MLYGGNAYGQVELGGILIMARSEPNLNQVPPNPVNPIILYNIYTTDDNAISADEEHGQFIDIPKADPENTGSLTLTSSGEFYGEGDLSLQIIIKTLGDVGVSKFLYSDDDKVTHFGMINETVWTDLQLIKNNI